HAASPRASRAAAVCPIPAGRAPTGNTRNRAPELLTCWASDGRTVGLTDRKTTRRTCRPTVRRSDRPSEALRLIDQHDRNVVFERVHQAARVAHQYLGGSGAVLDVALALRDDVDRQQGG